jgi:23S rRNA G2069 N7-methylase RlmK/C1962 C5-methylase RlmI
VFQSEKDFAALADAALPLLKSGGILLACTNAASYAPEDFLGALRSSVRRAGRRLLREQYAPQPPDFPVERTEPAYLKTVWMRIG